MQYDLHNNMMKGYAGGEQTALTYQKKKNDDIVAKIIEDQNQLMQHFEFTSFYKTDKEVSLRFSLEFPLYQEADKEISLRFSLELS